MNYKLWFYICITIIICWFFMCNSFYIGPNTTRFDKADIGILLD